MSNEPLISVIVLNYNGKKVLLPCIESVLKTKYPNFEIVLVDNCSQDGSIEDIERIYQSETRLRIVKNDCPHYYAGGNNIGFENSRGAIAVFINNDTEVDPAWLTEIRVAFDNPAVAAVQPKILYHHTPDTIDNVGQEFDVFGFGFGRNHNQKDRGQCNAIQEICFASGVAFAARSALLKRIGVFDEDYIFYYEDTDLSWRIRLAGYSIIYRPQAVVYHKVSKTTRVFSSVQELAFHSRKNRIATMLRNYSLISLLVFLPGTLCIYALMAFKELIIERNPALARTTAAALRWNITHWKDNSRHRDFCQKQIRLVSDLKILRWLHTFPLIFKYGV
ncbi:MAG TPA: glycosyltransferase family 2 protein [Candidatus Omnitrophota bacterium]|nr:glycosyltransferase family 2 protein [Candidatus Omnitrophota bacterium]HPT07783.1 glycosyltransferase family 2 protein [Candidatus Omnitrophota bacterium]